MSTNPSNLAESADLQKDDRLSDPESFFARRFVKFCQLIFRNRPPGDFKWHEELEDTEIVITDQVPMPLDTIEIRPHIQLVVAGIQNQNLGLDHLRGIDLRTGQRTHLDMKSGNGSFNVHARFDSTARKLARLVADRLVYYRRDLIRMAALHKVGHIVAMGPSSPPGALVMAGSDVESTMVSVQFPFFFSEAWTATPKLIPVGKADTFSDGLGPEVNTPLAEPRAIQRVNVDARMLKAGVTWSHEEGLRQVRSAALSPPTFRGRAMVVVQRLDQIDDDKDSSPYVKGASSAQEE